MLTDTVHSPGGWMQRCWVWFLGKKLGGRASLTAALHDRSLEKKRWTQWLLFVFSRESQNHPDFFHLEKTYYHRSFIKANWRGTSVYWEIEWTPRHSLSCFTGFFLIYLFWLHWIFVAVCRLPLAAEWELLLVVVCGLLGAGFSWAASLVVEHRLLGAWTTVVMAHRAWT